MVELLIFPFTKREGYFGTEPVDPHRAIFPIDWRIRNDLSKNLRQQIINSFVNLNLIKNSCENEENIRIFENKKYITGIYDERVHRKYNYDKDKCDKFLKTIDSYMDIFARDNEALEQYKFKNQIYAIVLLYNNEYYGHIYTWISYKRTFAIGIRARVDNLFLPDENKLKNISYYLLEGVRNFSITMKTKSYNIVNPLPIMRDILSNLNFERLKYQKNEIGNDMGKMDEELITCYTRDWELSIIENHILYTYM